MIHFKLLCNKHKQHSSNVFSTTSSAWVSMSVFPVIIPFHSSSSSHNPCLPEHILTSVCHHILRKREEASLVHRGVEKSQFWATRQQTSLETCAAIECYSQVPLYGLGQQWLRHQWLWPGFCAASVRREAFPYMWQNTKWKWEYPPSLQLPHHYNQAILWLGKDFRGSAAWEPLSVLSVSSPSTLSLSLPLFL